MLFSRTLITKLEEIREQDLANELKGWGQTSYMPSELLGELRIILYKIEPIIKIDMHLLSDVRECIQAIDEAFEKVT